VWAEYDQEKKDELEDRKLEEVMVKRSMEWTDLLFYSRRLVIEVWHESGFGSQQKHTCDVFMGEVNVQLDLESEPTTSEWLCCRLHSNTLKARRKVRGYLTFKWDWQPTERLLLDADYLLSGRLTVKVQKATQLIGVDWHSPVSCDAYCSVIAHPHSQSEDGKIIAVAQHTPTQPDTIDPVWDASLSFEMNWTRTNAEITLANDMKQPFAHVAGDSMRVPGRFSAIKELKTRSGSPKDEKVPPVGPWEDGWKAFPALRENVSLLKEAVSQFQADISVANKDMDLIRRRARIRPKLVAGL